MRAVCAQSPGGPEVLTVTERPDPTPGPDEIVLAVAYAGVNRADLLQRAGHYPPPPGESDIIGLECSGTVIAIGADVRGIELGEQRCALLAGGGYAEQVAVPAGQTLPIPAGSGLLEGAALPEAACTVRSSLFGRGGLRTGERVLIHGGAGGIGSHAIQLCHALGVDVLATAGTDAKRERCLELGARAAFDYRADVAAEVSAATSGAGVDVVLDNMGGPTIAANLQLLAVDGRLVVIGLQAGRRGDVDLGQALARRLSIHAVTLRSRSRHVKAEICADVAEVVWPLVTAGQVRPIVHEVFPLSQAADAHRLMASGTHSGKILLDAAR